MEEGSNRLSACSTVKGNTAMDSTMGDSKKVVDSSLLHVLQTVVGAHLPHRP